MKKSWADEWEKILSEWNRHGPLYNGIPEIEGKPVYIDTKTVYEVEEKAYNGE